MPISSIHPVILATQLKPDQGCRLRISKQILRHTRCPTRGVGLWFTAERRKRWGEPGRRSRTGRVCVPSCFSSDPRPFRIFQRKLEFPCQAVHGRTAAFPRALRLEALVADVRPHGAMTRPIARKSLRSAWSWSSRRTTSGDTRTNAQGGCGLDAAFCGHSTPRRTRPPPA